MKLIAVGLEIAARFSECDQKKDADKQRVEPGHFLADTALALEQRANCRDEKHCPVDDQKSASFAS